ncbi:MAG: cytochrome c [Opitutae bacterium]|nr:cytochrome c [Opitutae bacterium]
MPFTEEQILELCYIAYPWAIKSEEEDEVEAVVSVAEKSTDAPKWLQDQIDQGKEVYMKAATGGGMCFTCHQVNGEGLVGQFPPLAGSEWVSADPGVITNIILKGLKGEILVKGEKYGTSAAVNMAAVPISDREIANVSTYVRQAWGNSSDEVSEDFVKQVRADYTNKQDQWTGDELKSLYSTSF